MARFYGKVGFGTTIEKANGVWEDEVTERNYYGDVVRNARKLASGEDVISDITVSNSISIVADDHANGNIFAIRYIEWAGALWTVSDVEVESPRLVLRLGGVYNGPTVGVAVTP